MTTCLLSMMMMVAGNQDREAVAMVLAVQGNVTLQREDVPTRPARVMDVIFAGDRLQTTKGSSLQLVVLADGHTERVRDEAKLTVTAKGCSPEDLVQREASKLSATQLAGLRQLSRNDRGGAVVPRGPGDGMVTDTLRFPMKGETILGDRPNFSWEDKDALFGYLLEVTQLGERKSAIILKVEAAEARLDFPKDAKSLARGECYGWRVVALYGGNKQEVIVNSRFCVASPEQVDQAKELTALTKTDDSANRLLAATLFDSEAMYSEAMKIFTQLIKGFPQEPRYYEALAAYHERAGDVEKAKECRKKAATLSGEE